MELKDMNKKKNARDLKVNRDNGEKYGEMLMALENELDASSVRYFDEESQYTEEIITITVGGKTFELEMEAGLSEEFSIALQNIANNYLSEEKIIKLRKEN